MNDADVDFEKESEKWSPLIGKFILIFGEIEHSIQDVISHHLEGSIFVVNDLSTHLDKRIDLFDRILRQRCVDECVRSNLSSVVKSIKELRVVRNLLSHNGLSLSLEEDSAGDFRLVQFEVSSHKDKTGIGLSELENMLQELEHCRKLLSQLLIPFCETQWKRGQGI